MSESLYNLDMAQSPLRDLLDRFEDHLNAEKLPRPMRHERLLGARQFVDFITRAPPPHPPTHRHLVVTHRHPLGAIRMGKPPS